MSPRCRNCQLQPDVFLKSSDGVLLAAHKEYLARFSEGFPPFDESSQQCSQGKVEVVPLTEQSTVLEQLLKFMHPDRPPDSKTIPVSVLIPLAEAAEKYRVFSAMEICKLRMEMVALDADPLAVLAYAMKHRYRDLVKLAACRVTSDLDLAEAARAFDNTDDLVLWLKYRDKLILYDRSFLSPPSQTRHCAHDDPKAWNAFREAVRDATPLIPAILKLENLGRYFAAVEAAFASFDPKPYRGHDMCCAIDAKKWFDMVRAKLEAIPQTALEDILATC